jgi:DNA-directed RNA polymerase subunit RPC12/RpoP
MASKGESVLQEGGHEMKCSNCGNNNGAIILMDEVVCPKCYLKLTAYIRDEITCGMEGDGDGVDF